MNLFKEMETVLNGFAEVARLDKEHAQAEAKRLREAVWAQYEKENKTETEAN